MNRHTKNIMLLRSGGELDGRPQGRSCTAGMKNIHDDLSSQDLGIYEARDLVQNRPLCRLMSAQCYAVVVVLATIGLDWIAGNVRGIIKIILRTKRKCIKIITVHSDIKMEIQLK